LPLYIVANIIGTPIYMLVIFFNCANKNFSDLRCFSKIMVITISLLLYIFIPYVFLIISLPNIAFTFIERLYEIKSLLKNRCKFYLEADIEPLRRKYMKKLKVWRS
jgi:hypothetical protein